MVLHHGDCLDILKTLPDNSVDSLVTDPPYGLSFMGKKWDYDVPSIDVWKECLRVLKPGGHALIACGTRTQHRMAVNIEDAGFEIRDIITWLYGSGFPKSLNIGKQGGPEGWGTALKPACEFWTLARKPLSESTVAKNVQLWGTGGINIDGCRVDLNGGKKTTGGCNSKDSMFFGEGNKTKEDQTKGRFPANLILDEVAGAQLDLMSGILKSGHLRPVETKKQNAVFGEYAQANINEFKSNQGGASRFFYCAKASKSERGEDNKHPTVKPIKLMSYLCRLITPPNGTVLDPFMGSGSTGVAAKQEGFQFIGIEREAEYIEIAKARINGGS